VHLQEWRGKELLARHGMPVPRGCRWSPGDGLRFRSGGVVKAQIVGGRRGERGGVVICPDASSVEEAASQLLGTRIGDELVESVYVEDRIQAERELYLALLVDRDTGLPRLLLGPRGGVDIESRPDTVVGVALDLDVGPRPWVVRELCRHAAMASHTSALVAPAVDALWRAFVAEDAELMEINPLALTAEGLAIALDARVVLDDNAAFRHPERAAGPPMGTPFERRCQELGAVGIEMDGDIAAVVSGAGLMMATVDLIVESAGRVRAAVDLGGLVLREADELAELVNAFFQLATCDALARKLATGLERRRLHAPLVVRLRGRGLADAQVLLEPFGACFESDLGAAVRTVVAAAG
jgi:succinyl-CoA synthetase beta subunit